MSREAAQARGVSTPGDPLLSLKELSTYSSLSVRTLRAFTALPPERALPCYRLPGKTLVRRSEFDRWIEQYRSQGRQSLAKALREMGLARPAVQAYSPTTGTPRGEGPR